MESISQKLEQNLDQYDLVPLPSGGKFYENKLTHVYVSYLNGDDEALFLSPNLLQSGDLIDELLKRKIKGGKDSEGKDLNSVDSLELLDGDRIAILVYLRAMFEPMYRIYYPNDKLERFFDFNLATLNFNSMTDKESTDNFTYTLPKSGDIVTYRFLTGKDQKAIRDIQKKSNAITNDSVIENMCRSVKKVVKADGTELSDAISIKMYLKALNLKDFRNLNKYIQENTPTVDLKVEIPSLSGGEATETFLPITSEFFFPTN